MEHQPIQPERSTAELLKQLATLRAQAELQHLTLPDRSDSVEPDAWGAASPN